MTKQEYFEISESKKLSPRCPCLHLCARYRYTALFIGNYYLKHHYDSNEKLMKKMHILSEKEELAKMIEEGESPLFISGNSSFFISNGCPEFFLHEHEHKPSGMKPVAVHQYSFDEYYRTDKFKPGESRHYTECPEYSIFIHSNKIKKNSIRKTIPYKIKALLQKEVKSICPFCTNEDVGHFEIHHIDENRENNDYENLIMLCKICHSKITKGDIPLKAVEEKKLAIKIL